MKVCLDVRSQSGAGLTTIIDNLTREIRRIAQGIDFTFLCHSSQRLAVGDHRIWTIPPMSRVRELFWIQTRLPGLLHRGRFDLYHSLKHIGPLRCPCASILSLNEVGQYLGPRDLPVADFVYWTYLEPLALRRADHVIAISDWCRKVAVEKLGIDPKKISVAPCGLDPIFLTPRDPSAGRAVRGRFGLPDRYFLAVGSITPKKNLETVIRALAKFRAGGSECAELVIAGGPGYRANEIRDLIRQLDLQSKVHLTGFLTKDDLVHLYREALALVYPSHYESFGIPPVEAMACGIPVITSRRGAIPEVTGGLAWYLVEPTDAEGLADLMAAVLRDSPERRERLEKARDWVRRYRWRAAADSILQTYASFAG